MSDATITRSWLALFEHLQTLPGPDDPEPEWCRNTVALLRRALAAGAVFCVLPAASRGRWQLSSATETGEELGESTWPELPGWLLERLARSGVIGLAGPRAAAETPGARAGEPVLPPGLREAVTIGAPIPLARGRGGALLILRPAPGPPAAGLAAVAALVGRAIDNRRQVLRLEADVITDELTGAYNFRFLRTALRYELERAKRFGQPLSVLMLDVDHLKEYNERFGHLRGSRVLKLLAADLRAGIRAVDILAKYGGDEFVLILPQTGKVGAHVLADRLRQRVAARVFPRLSRGELTCSLGVASYPEDGDTAERLMAAADRALFGAKDRGRNRVRSA